MAEPQQSWSFTDKPREECGVVGVYSPLQRAARVAFFGLFALQHRGQESAGIASSNGQFLRVHTNMGLVAQAFREDALTHLQADMAIGHTRYSTTGSSTLANAQPFVVSGINGQLALGHNGNLVNALALRKKLQSEWDLSFASSSDSEVLAYLLVNAPGDSWDERLAYVMRNAQGAYSAVVQTREVVIGFKDPLGVRPLCLGKLSGGGWILASESCALDHVGAEYVRELEPAEAVIIDRQGMRSFIWPGRDNRRALCVFELIYFSRPDTQIDGSQVYSMRRAMGAKLAQEQPAEGDVVIGIPDSATAAAMGYAAEIGYPLQRWADKKPLRRQDIHRAGPETAGVGRSTEVQSSAGRHRREASDSG